MPSNLFRFGDWLYIAPVALLGLALGVFGFMNCADCTANGISTTGGPVGFVSAITHSLALIKASGNFPLDSGRGHIPLFFAQIIMPALAFIGVLKVVLQNLRRDTRVLLAQRLKDHTIVCGLGETGREVVESFRDAGRPVVAIALKTDTPYAANAERRNVAVLEGDASQKNLLKLAGLKRAHSLIIACGSDGANLEIGMRARDMLAGAGRGVKILPELRSEWLFELVQTQNAAALSSAEAEFQLFNLGANAARELLRQPFFLRAAPEASPSPHFLFAGMGRVSTEILLRAARTTFAIPGQKFSATILDERGPAALAAAEAASPGIRDIADLGFVPCQFNAEDTAWAECVTQAIKDRPPLAVIVAVRLDDVALNTATKLRRILDELGHFATPVFVRIREQRQLAHFLSGLEAQSFFHDRLTAFGGLAFLTSPAVLLDQTLDILARAAHEIWLAENQGSRSIAMAPWDKLSEFHKQANRALADYVPVRLRCCGFRLEAGRGKAIELDDASVEKLAALEHWRWCVTLTSMGWRYAPERDEFLKRHDGLLPWEKLAEGAKNYNRKMARLLPETADAAGMHVLRDRVVFADRGLELVPGDAREGTQLVVAADPQDRESWSRARAAQAAGAKLWALLPENASPRLFRQLGSESGAVEKLLRREEWDRLRRETSA